MYEFLEKHKVSLLYVPLVLYWITLLILTSIPDVPRISDFTYEDKVKHFLAYGGLATLLSLVLHYQNKFHIMKKNYHIVAYFIIIVYSLFDEVHQEFIPGRYGDFNDFLANLSGAIIAILLVYLFVKKQNSYYAF
ncbi:MAG: VanZ family protein [Melioribacteraceae bacterium]|nr:VanZ family protein [Melioribacteraceae bacterium]MCF8264373.1 VanZ family protein [Melioribacteraceae bacterium]MCF8414032.1 VanZ family protein [Melioribacteraceae bacterium]